MLPYAVRVNNDKGAKAVCGQAQKSKTAGCWRQANQRGDLHLNLFKFVQGHGVTWGLIASRTVP